MKRQRLVSSFTPALQEWLEEELENRGVDSVYARSILSLLQQDYVDVEPHEYQSPRNHQHRVSYKYGGPENLSYASKSKHQKWKTWGKHILSSASPCRKATYYDLERLLKKAAVDCLKSASDYAYDIEELIDEVWVKLKSKSLKGEQEEIALRNRNPLGHSFFIPPSPTDEIEKYFAAFPPLSSKNECAVETAKHKILKNAWCKNCNLKRKSNVQDEEALNAENQNFHSNKSVQPIIPYRSLKTIKNIFKNSGFKSSWKASCAQQGTVSKRAVSYGVKSFKLPAMIGDSLLSFSNLTSANIHEISLNKIELLTLLKDVGIKNVLLFCNEAGVSKEASVAKSLFIRRSNELSLSVLQEEESDLIFFPKAMNPEDSSKKYAAGHITSSGAFSEENSLNDAKGLSDYHGIDIHFRMSPLADLLEYESPCLEPSDDCSTAVPEINYYFETLKYYFPTMVSSCNINNSELYTQPDVVINGLESENPMVQRENALTCHKSDSYFVGESKVHSLNSIRALDVQSDLYSQNASFSIKQSFNPLDIINTSHVETSLFFSDTESDKHVESITSSNFESCCSDDEIYYSDDDSNEIFRSENEENSNFSEIPFQQTEQNCVLNRFSEDTLAETEIEDASISEPNQYNLIFSVDSEERSVLDNNEFKHDKTEQKLLKVLNLGSDDVNFINVRSPCKELPFISYSQSESVDMNYVTEQNANYDYFPNIFDERKSGLPIENYSLANSNDSDKVVASSASKCTAGALQKSSEIYDKKWLFYWGDNHNFIARTWQKDFVPVEEKESKEQLFYDAKISTALCKEIKEEEEELLKGLCSVPTIGSTVFVNELCKFKQNDLHSSQLPSQIESLSNGCEEKTSLYVQVPESHKIAVNQVENYIPIMNNSFTFDNIENNVPDMQCTGDYSVSFENNPFKAANFPDLSAFSNASEENGSFKDYYMEGGGWSLASDSFADYYCDNPYERSCSMSDLDLEKSNNDYLEFFYQKRQRCTSETDDMEMTGYNDAPNPYKRSKQKLAPKKRPCCFFLQGTCTRSDCRYSHDLSNITCRFWRDGSCFKGPMCPFLHGYLPENEERHLQDDAYLRSQSPDLSYSLESEADFPSLSSSKSEEPKVKSEAINIPFVKGSKKKRREK